MSITLTITLVICATTIVIAYLFQKYTSTKANAATEINLNELFNNIPLPIREVTRLDFEMIRATISKAQLDVTEVRKKLEGLSVPETKESIRLKDIAYIESLPSEKDWKLRVKTYKETEGAKKELMEKIVLAVDEYDEKIVKAEESTVPELFRERSSKSLGEQVGIT